MLNEIILGFSCPTYHNPADFYLDIVGGDVNTAQLIDRMNAAASETSIGWNPSKQTMSVASIDAKSEKFMCFLELIIFLVLLGGFRNVLNQLRVECD